MDNNNKILFPEIQPYSDGYLDLDGLHKMYWQQSGNPDGLPVVVIHGGPGAGLNPLHRRFFDPEFYRIIAYDQRGAGRSTPNGEVKDNTTQHLIEDIEKLKNHLGIDKWLVSGASWGSTLALLQTFYSHHRLFLQGYDILDNMAELRKLPGFIIHARYDMVCPILTAFDLAHQWPKAELVIVPDAGHTNYEGSFPEEIVKASQ